MAAEEVNDRQIVPYDPPAVAPAIPRPLPFWFCLNFDAPVCGAIGRFMPINLFEGVWDVQDNAYLILYEQGAPRPRKRVLEWREYTKDPIGYQKTNLLIAVTAVEGMISLIKEKRMIYVRFEDPDDLIPMFGNMLCLPGPNSNIQGRVTELESDVEMEDEVPRF